MTVLISAQEGTEDNYINSKYQVDYTIGYENDQLKILHGKGKKSNKESDYQSTLFKVSSKKFIIGVLSHQKANIEKP